MAQTKSSGGSMLSRDYTEALEQALGRVVADARREFEVHRAKSDALLAAMQSRLTETELRCRAMEAEAKEAVEDRLAAVRDGKDADPADIKRMVTEAVARIPAARDGKDADPAELEALRVEIAEAKAAVAGIVIPPPDFSGLATKADLESLAHMIDHSDEMAALHDAIGEVRSGLGAIVIPAAPDLSGLATKDDLAEALRAIPELPKLPDFSGFATKADFELLLGKIPAVPDLSGFATKDDVSEVLRAIPEAPEPPDLSGFATKADLESVCGEIPAAPDLSGLATKVELEALPVPRDGKDADMDEVARMIGEEVAKAVAELPRAKDGADADMPAILRHVEDAVSAAIPPKEELRGPAGRLPPVKAWADAVHYEGAVVAHKGALWQASADTGREPPHADWTCLAARGDDGRSIDVRGTYEDGAEYRALDIVALNGGSFIALRDAPGDCPGDGWQLLAGRGKPGQAIKGDKGDKGDDGDDGRDAAEIVAFHSAGGSAVITLADGREFRLDLGPIVRGMLA